MRLFIIAFAAGIFLLQQQAFLPSVMQITGAVGVALVLLWARAYLQLNQPWRSVSLATAAFLFGMVWAAILAQVRLDDALPFENEGRDIEISGVVASMPQTMERGTRFEFEVEEANFEVPRRISLAWYIGADSHPFAPVHAGERWRFTIRLKRPHGNMNPDGFDYEAWLFERNIRATGYVRPKGAERLNSQLWSVSTTVEILRERLRSRIQRALSDNEGHESYPYSGILVALVIGDQNAIAADLWRLFAQTGITHLMSISGLHVTLFATLAYFLCSWIWRRSEHLPLMIPAQKVAVIGGFLAAFAYCLLAGFAVPAQRTLYMLGVLAASRLSGRELASSQVLALALLVVLLIDPWAVLAAGFWLSFGAVALLFIVGSGRIGANHWLVEWGRTQWAITLGILPALLALFQQFSLVSPIANALAIPLVSFVITPLALLGTLPLMTPLLSVAHFFTAGLMFVVNQLAAIPGAQWQQATPPGWAVLLASAGSIWLLLPRGIPNRWLGAMAFIPLLTLVPPRPLPGVARIATLDVGQGLAVHIQTATHDMLFDTGPAYSAEADSGNRIIAPYLRSRGVRRLDMLMISHADMDHAGGATSVLSALPVALIKASLPFEHALSASPVPYQSCLAGERWDWDGVTFELLHPPHNFEAPKTNNVSCVLRISTVGGQMLLTSDIEALAEKMLVAQFAEKLKADVLTVPHHGSRTSSTAEFISAVAAKEAIFPVGYRNSFGHPKSEVVERYVASGARLHRTDLNGAVMVAMSEKGIEISHERDRRWRYWHSRSATLQ